MAPSWSPRRATWCKPVQLSTLPNTAKYNASTVALSPDGRTVFASSADRTVRAWDITDRDHPVPAATITGHAGAFVSPAISPDGKTLAIGGQDQTIWLWDISDPHHATPLGSPIHSPSSAGQVAFSPDGKTLASGNDNGSVLLWDIADRAHPAAIGESLIPPGVASRTRVAFDPQGRLYAVSRDGTIRIFNLSTDNTTRICASTRNVRSWWCSRERKFTPGSREKVCRQHGVFTVTACHARIASPTGTPRIGWRGRPVTTTSPAAT
jgi:WD40 repeat protein